jgi:predicted DNA-binding transcriptional regulator YafY
MAAPRLDASARIQRLLALLQWAADRPEGVPVDELCGRFAIKASELARELDLASLVGADSVHYDEMPFEVFVEDGRVYVRLFSFRRPLRLTPAEGLALVAAADVLVQDGDVVSPLARALAKLAALLGIEPGRHVDVDLDPEGGVTGRVIRDALNRGRRVGFRYWTYGRDEVAEREVDPWRLFSDRGVWYLAAWDHRAEAERRFRVDRMEQPTVLDSKSAKPPKRVDTTVGVTSGAPEVTLDLAPSARWVTEAHPVLAVASRADGITRATLAVDGPAWLERLLLQLGSDATVVAIDPSLGTADLTAATAARVLCRYREGSGEGLRH